MNVFVRRLSNFALKKVNFLNVFKLKQTPAVVNRTLTSSKLDYKVVVCGAFGEVGRTICLLLKSSPLISELILYDTGAFKGIALDLYHINTKTKLKHFGKLETLPEALENSDIIVITSTEVRKEGMKRSDLFKPNVGVVKEVTSAMAKSAPNAMLCIVANPINSLVPVATGILEKAKKCDPRRIFGITTIDCIRASSYAAKLVCYDPSKLIIPVIGGHGDLTTVPVFSQSSKPLKIPRDKLQKLIEKVQNAGGGILQAKDGKGTSTLGTGYATARFVLSLCRAMNGEEGVVECSYVKSDVTEAQFFATPILLGRMGIKKNLGYGVLNRDECCLMKTAVKILIKEIETSAKFLDGGEDKEKEKKK